MPDPKGTLATTRGRGLAPNPKCIFVAIKYSLAMPGVQSICVRGYFPHPCCAAPLPVGEGPGVRAVLNTSSAQHNLVYVHNAAVRAVGQVSGQEATQSAYVDH